MNRHARSLLNFVNRLKVGPWISAFLLAAAFVIVFIVIIWRPWEKRLDPISDNAALAWNRTIERLGMQPIYPPQEDFYVGDVYLVVNPIEEFKDKTEFSTSIFEGKATMVGHVDLFESILASRRPVYRTTMPTQVNLSKSQLRRLSPTDGPVVDLSLVGFPGITIRHLTNADAGWFTFDAARAEASVESVTINKAETYAAPVSDAYVALHKFCDALDTAMYCEDEFARKLLSYNIGEKIYATVEGKYVFRIVVTLVNQVYTTKDIIVSRRYLDRLSLEANSETPEPHTSQPTRPSAPAPQQHHMSGGGGNQSPTTQGQVGEGDVVGTSNGLPTPPTQERSSGTAEGAANTESQQSRQRDPSMTDYSGRFSDGTSSHFTLNVKYDAPLVFGFKSIAYSLTPSTPNLNLTKEK